MSERGPEINISTEQVSKVVTLSREITRIKVLDDRSPEADERARNFLKGNFSSQYESVEQMVNLSRDPGRLENDVAKKNAQESLNLLGSALLLAGQDKKIETWVTGAEVYKHLPSSFAGVERILQNNLLVNGKDDEIGKGIVEQLAALEKANRRAAMAPNSYKEKKREQTQETINNLLDVYDTVDSDSEAGLKIGAVVGCLDSELVEEVVPERKSNENNDDFEKSKPESESGLEVDEGVIGDEDDNEVDFEALRQMMSDPEKAESLYTITEDYFVKMCFDYESPRLFPQTPGRWFKKKSEIEQYKIQIQQRLVEGVGYKLGTKDISAEKARDNKIYNFPTKEMKLIYEMDGVKEAMETFVQGLFEFYTEDGREFLRLKQCKAENIKNIPLSSKDKKKAIEKYGDNESSFDKYRQHIYYVDNDGYVRAKEDDLTVMDPLIYERSGNGTGSFEEYREAMFYKMAMRKLVPGKDKNYYDNNWKKWKSDQVEEAIKKYRAEVINKKGKGVRIKEILTDAEIEYGWVVKNCLEEKRAVAAAWNFLFVGNIVESADVNRQLKPTQINSDKIRTMMMPNQKFLVKNGVYEEKLTGKEEGFGVYLGNWTINRLEEEQKNKRTEFRDKLRYAQSHDWSKMNEDQRMWRLMPKRTTCSFIDMFKVETKSGREMTMAKALMEGEEINFKPNDLDVFVNTRDVWDELNTTLNPMIGKAEIDAIKDSNKFASMLRKLRGITTSVFGRDNFTKSGEYFAWFVANSVGIETDLDIPILNRTKLNKDWHYDVSVDEIARSLNLNSEQARVFKKILNAEGWWSSKNAIKRAEDRRDARARRH